MSEPKPTFRLHIWIATAFLLLVAGVGAVLVWHNHQSSREIILSASRQLFGHLGQEVAHQFTGTLEPAATAVELLRHARITRARNLSQRMESLPVLQAALEAQPGLSAMQVGYENGDFFILRPLRDSTLREQFDAPAGAVLVADDISLGGDGSRRMTRLFFDRHLRELTRKTLPEPDYDPRRRPWYRLAMQRDALTLGQPYLYYFLRKIGVTLARRSAEDRAVVAADLTLDTLSLTLAGNPVSPSSELVLFDASGHVLGYHQPERLVISGQNGAFRIATLEELGSPLLEQVARRLREHPQSFTFEHQGARWIGSVQALPSGKDLPLYLALLAPEKELLADAYRISRNGTLVALLLLLLSLPLVWWLARRIGLPLQKLAGEARRIQRLDFSGSVETGSRILEIRRLSLAIDDMKHTINRFLGLITALSGEQDFDRLLELFATETLEASGVDGVGVLLHDRENDDYRLVAWRSRHSGWLPDDEVLPVRLEGRSPLLQALRNDRPQQLRLDRAAVESLAPVLPTAEAPLQAVSLPLLNRQQEQLGSVLLVSRGEREQGGSQQWLQFITALSGFTAVSLETRQLLASRKALLDAFIQVIAGAIDAKSPYTGGHCQRVPALTLMLDDAAARSTEPPFSDYLPSDAEREALEIAAWLHDCGKVTTPEYVVDKATRLETIYNRIHEIRTRFEVLKRDAWIRYWRELAGGGDEADLKMELERELAELDDDFAFVASCNDGDQPMDAERIARLHRIARRTWTRTLDDRLGLSREEAKRKALSPTREPPVTETLLTDREEHRLPWPERDRRDEGEESRFRMPQPEYRLNLGELYNLGIERGTLTPEERYLINHHIVQTILMLEQLPYPGHLRQVPLLAGSHHEQMDGNGYPLKVPAGELPLAARMMAIADIFEALTASDRPYKQAKTLNESLRILWFMKQEGHIDPQLFDLFLKSGVYLEYARRFLAPEQIDEVELDRYLG